MIDGDKHETHYVLITQCLQNDFFFNTACNLCLPEGAAARLLFDANDPSEFEVKDGQRVLSDRSREASPLFQFLRTTVGSRIDGDETSHLHLIYQIVRHLISLAAAQFSRTTAICPSGTVVFGGGVYNGGSASVGEWIQESAPGTIGGGAESLWLAAIQNGREALPATGVYAICANKSSGYTVVHQSVGLGVNAVASASASCPTGAEVVDGGAAVTGEGNGEFGTQIQESLPVQISATSAEWETVVYNTTSAQHTLGFYAICQSRI